ncbi:MAG: hypothetical protein ACK2U5_02235 [Candidatus Promineifilaceae bacterium]|jgi:hypothetical protein
MIFRRILRTVLVLLMFFATILVLAPEWTKSANEDTLLQSIVGLLEYDFLVWESSAFGQKGEAILSGGQEFLSEEARKEVVLDYLALVHQSQLLEGELNRIYADPDILNPENESQAIQEELQTTRAAIEEKQPLAEAIVQEQVAEILSEQEFSLMGQAWPPVLMHVTELPSLLVVSPRDRIEKAYQVTLEQGLTTPVKEVIEDAVLDDLDQSGLVVPLGGIGTYPSMIVETSDINRLAEVVTHEWAHHWLTLRPLGIRYGLDPDVRIINETVASLVDEELGQIVVERYYPEFLPLPPDEAKESAPQTADPPAFDFQTELANTRIRVEELLADGRIEEAETYMEERRREFLEHGYIIRKLNQAYFAFYGAYAAEPGGAQGSNPIGPMLREIRANSSSIHAFMEKVAPITSFEDLVKVYHEAVPAEPSV